MVSHICCNGMFQNVSSISVFYCSKCFHVANCKCSIWMLYMFSHIHCKCMSQMFHLFQMYVASVLSGCYIYCSGYTHIVDVCFNCFTLFQYVGTGAAPHMLYLAGKHALQGAPAPPGVVPQSMQSAQHMCMRAILPLSLSLTLGQVWCALSL
jgi:hypothetical protein